MQRVAQPLLVLKHTPTSQCTGADREQICPEPYTEHVCSRRFEKCTGVRGFNKRDREPICEVHCPAGQVLLSMDTEPPSWDFEEHCVGVHIRMYSILANSMCAFDIQIYVSYLPCV